MIDAHQHFWEVARGDYHWMTPDLPIARDYGPEDLAPLMARTGMSRTILVQAAETEAETDFLLDLAARTDFVAGVVGWLDMTSPDFPARLAAYRGRPKWVGLRPMLQDHDPAWIVEPAFLENLAHVAKAQVPFDILTFPRHLPNLVSALRHAPGLRGVIDHISKPAIADAAFDAWSADMETLARIDTLYCKISGIVTEAGDWSMAQIRPYVARVAELFGPKRLIFGSDWPVCTLAGSYGEVMALARTLLSEIYGPDDLANIFERNAARFYGV